jgi:hypothetical protein
MRCTLETIRSCVSSIREAFARRVVMTTSDDRDFVAPAWPA